MGGLRTILRGWGTPWGLRGRLEGLEDRLGGLKGHFGGA